VGSGNCHSIPILKGAGPPTGHAPAHKKSLRKWEEPRREREAYSAGAGSDERERHRESEREMERAKARQTIQVAFLFAKHGDSRWYSGGTKGQKDESQLASFVCLNAVLPCMWHTKESSK